MNAFFEFLKWFIKVSLIATVAIGAMVIAFVLGRKSVKPAKIESSDD